LKKWISFSLLLLIISCSAPETEKIPIIVDTDANNELDDQHALAYLFFNTDIFDIKGITTNATYNGGAIEKHYNEARRVMQLCGVWEKYPLYAGANKDFDEIAPDIDSTKFDGYKAVEFIIKMALDNKNGKLVLVPIGKLTNIALAIKKEPRIKEKVRIVWLGSNYPAPGEYNLENDISAANYILNQDVEFEMVTVRYGEATGSDAVRITPNEISRKLKGKGPRVEPVVGRHGGQFETFGDYSINLFSKIDFYGDPPSRALFDLVAVAIIKNPKWGEIKSIPAPYLVNSSWYERPDNKRNVIIWENFDKKSILSDFYKSIEQGN
jgi:purine nucleosidase